LKPRAPKPVSPADKPNRNSVTPHDADRNQGHCLYELKEPFSITLMSVSNVSVDDFSLVTHSLVEVVVVILVVAVVV